MLLMRYGNQPVSEIDRLPVRRALAYAAAVMDLIGQENARGDQGNHG